jgi:FkbM family methyltransferase
MLASNEHGLYCVPRSSHHRPVAQAILAHRVWEAETLELICAADPGADVIHAGTFFGDFLPALSRSRTGDGSVWAFEPHRENHRAAQITILLNDLRNVELTPAGLSAERGAGLLAVGDREGVPLGGSSRIIQDRSRARWWEHEEVPMVRIDDVVGEERRITAIHLDVEGHEQQALTGALATIERCRPMIVVETLPDDAWLAGNLEPLGYRVQTGVNRNSVLRCS